MTARKVARTSGVVLAAAALAILNGMPGSAQPASTDSAPAFEAAHPGLVSAMQRDLGLDAAEARTLMVKQDAATATEDSLRTSLGSSFAGAWFDISTAKLTVAVTDAADAAEVKSAGAEATVVARSAAQLDAKVAQLDAVEKSAPASVTGWYADSRTNSVVVTALPGKTAEATAFAGSDVRVVEADAPTTFANIKGGDAYNIGSSRCSAGLSVNGGFVTAGHCRVLTGGGALTRNGTALGTWGGASFPGNDYAWVRTNSSWTPQGLVGSVRVTGTTAAATGAAVCKSGSTTGWTCGTVGAKNQTVRYAEGAVSGLTATSVLCQAGDSGGGFITSAGQGQGVVSGGNTATCYFNPVGEILSAYGLTIVRG
ncbi:S1 family peptidase [Actinosynnema pretiosum subsp. pretiosum]|uniref:Peptidase S1 and S6 chymotrypsin/Hap n=2 Tax=Actinosynnema TaxID=40566 RepID=C6WIR1_ACTMD|nr:S1 family peptidase [Actinosynnema mirum]ACU38151.1 peptidase S1 and S6 chymotrypsin/Hap [Actinosynnema mirum DSM 43827]AXX31652.1 Alpha-Lytic Protease [Actinosynnema pretiosum subsp. pretiosum]QUF04329.1 S1 family peptidase [Actinosynnema pretiosum subsp. pretiosum]